MQQVLSESYENVIAFAARKLGHLSTVPTLTGIDSEAVFILVGTVKNLPLGSV